MQSKDDFPERIAKKDQGTQMEEHRALIPFNFAKELQNFNESHVLALRQAKEKDERLVKEYSIKDLRQKADKTKRNQIEICRLAEHTNSILRNVTEYNCSVADKTLAESEARKAAAQERL
mgnify:CR=1 FL=1